MRHTKNEHFRAMLMGANQRDFTSSLRCVDSLYRNLENLKAMRARGDTYPTPYSRPLAIGYNCGEYRRQFRAWLADGNIPSCFPIVCVPVADVLWDRLVRCIHYIFIIRA
jgi:hypothetical protein